MAKKKQTKKQEKEVTFEDLVLRYIHILDDMKDRVGLADYRIFIDTEIRKEKNTLAITEFDIYEKTLTVTVTEEFIKKQPFDQVEILLHELVHARIGIFKEEKQKITEYLEEEFANDMTNIHMIDILALDSVDELYFLQTKKFINNK